MRNVRYLQKVLSYTVPPVVAMFLGGIFSKKVNKSGAYASLISGLILGVVFFMSNEVFHYTNVHFLYIAPILFIVCIIVLFGVSYRIPVQANEELIWSKDFFNNETAILRKQEWYKNYRFLSIILALITAVLVISFW